MEKSDENYQNRTLHEPLDLSKDVADLTADLIDIYSVSGEELTIADKVEEALNKLDHLSVKRDENAIVARTNLGKDQRVILAGHLDTVPLPSQKSDNKTFHQRGTVPSQWVKDDQGRRILYGRGTTDMKGGVAIQLALAAALANPQQDMTYVFYDNEEVDASLNGLGRISRNHPEWLQADFGILLEPTYGTVEGGCNGTLRFHLITRGTAAHSARAWMGDNAIHKTSEVLSRLAQYQPETINVDGLDYIEGLNAVKINAGVAGNVIPDETVTEINYRFAPDKTLEQAEEKITRMFSDIAEVHKTDGAAGAKPGLDHPVASSFIKTIGQEPKPKYGWTDVSRLGELEIPAINFGPGDPLLAHSDDEHVSAEEIRQTYRSLHNWLTES